MSSPKLGRPKLRLWPAFVWAAFPPILLIGLGALLTLNGDPPPFFLVLLLVTASICERLGLGHFYILGGKHDSRLAVVCHDGSPRLYL
jgi:hypothetical protein